jgi:biopolymer transport protein TolR
MAKSSKSFAVRPQVAAKSEINVTPLVDVVLVLLIIFMVVTPLLEKDIPVRVPTSEKPEEPKDVPPEQILVHVPRYGSPRINSEEVALAEYERELRARLAPRSPSQRIVFVTADDETGYGRLIDVIDRTKLAGADTVGFATDPPDAPANVP